jgi:K+/H+ antiporter YhaU regulatory subunit KhtT
MQNNTVLKDKVMQLEQNLTTLWNTDFSLDFRNKTSHLEKALQITNNKLNAVINDAIARKHNFSVMSQQVAGLMQVSTVLKDNVLQFGRNLSAMEIPQGSQVLF